ncbi:hypothetical protein [Xanthocytophaga agilis]|uniref:PA14 domain-containing protein n=1 Tax=Xanthocytophaga agilis TaxID=3048010 RepID=A0AAE3RCF1_9BACT|nr:hypothetical protein [Xanthocytophaga agilis]MDJ1505794.1 hypothetical protein [Xanthocytophaga agilis]
MVVNALYWSEGITKCESRSLSIPLQAGKRYYIEALHKEATSGDNLAVGWQTPLMATTATPVVIPGTCLSPYGISGAREVTADRENK